LQVASFTRKPYKVTIQFMLVLLCWMINEQQYMYMDGGTDTVID